MLVPYTVLLLLEAAHGCLAQIELAPSVEPSGGRHWLWIERNTVTALQVTGEDQASGHVFDHAVLTLDGMRGELRWPDGRCEALSVDPSGSLRPEFHRLLHQHLN